MSVPPAFDPTQWNSRFCAFARSEGFQDPQAYIDQKAPTTMHFLGWNRLHLIEFAKEHPKHFAHGSLANEKAHFAYDAWLLEKYPIVG